MKVDLTPAFRGGNKGITIYQIEGDRFMVSVKSELGGFLIGYGDTPDQGLRNALRPAPREADAADIFGDLF